MINRFHCKQINEWIHEQPDWRGDKNVLYHITHKHTDLDRYLDRKQRSIHIVNLFSDEIPEVFTKNNLDILDISCGMGDYVQLLNKFQHKCIGTEIHKDSKNNFFGPMHKLMNFIPIPYKFADIYLPFNDNSFDIIYCYGALHQAKIDEIPILINEWIKKLKPNGLLSILINIGHLTQPATSLFAKWVPDKCKVIKRWNGVTIKWQKQ